MEGMRYYRVLAKAKRAQHGNQQTHYFQDQQIHKSASLSESLIGDAWLWLLHLHFVGKVILASKLHKSYKL
jgi:hypothetical protein